MQAAAVLAATLLLSTAAWECSYLQVRPVHDVLWDASNEVEAFEHDLVVKHTAGNVMAHEVPQHKLAHTRQGE
jgi:hypothetical protein